MERIKDINQPLFLLVGNIVAERTFGTKNEIRKGTKHFSAGTKVYIIDWYPGMCETIIVIGLNKKTKRLIRICLKVDSVENLRIRAVYKPKIIYKISMFFDKYSELTYESAFEMLNAIPLWQQSLRNK